MRRALTKELIDFARSSTDPFDKRGLFQAVRPSFSLLTRVTSPLRIDFVSAFLEGVPHFKISMTSIRIFRRLLVCSSIAFAALALVGTRQAMAYGVAGPAQDDPFQREINRRIKVASRTNGNSRAYAAVPESHSIPPSVPALGQNFDYLPTHTTRLICRVQGRFFDTNSSDVRREQLIDRLSAQLTVTPSTTIGILTDPYYCDSIQPEEDPYLFYAGNTYGTPTAEDLWEETYTTLSVISPSPPPMEKTLKPSSLPAKKVPIVDDTDKDLTFAPEPTESDKKPISPDIQTKLRMLCRAQQRGMKNAYFHENVEDVAKLFAANWSMDESIIAEALRNPELCSKPTESMLAAAADEEMHEAPPDDSDPYSMPKALLIMIGGIAFAFIVVILFLVFNLVKSTNKMVEKK